MKETVEQRFLRHARNLREKGKIEMQVVCPHCGHEFNTSATGPLADARTKAGLTLRDVSLKVGMSVRQVNRMEHGEVQVYIPMARKIAKLYGSTVEELWPEPEAGTPELPMMEDDPEEFEDDDPTTAAPFEGPGDE